MATTDAKPGFRLPWSSDRSEPANSADAPTQSTPSETSNPPQEIETPEMIDAAPAATDHEAAVEMPAAVEPAVEAPATTVAAAPVAPAPAASAAGRKPNKFMADLTKAMQAAAETAREDTLARFNAEAKTHIEGIHTDSASEATDLRKRADDDVAAIREWSKAEIARIREETDERIAHRKTTLEHEIDEHAAAIEARIERVQARVTAFETEMAAFFERLLAEDDPTRFAAMAESLPEPPPFDGPMPDREASWTPAPPEPAHAAAAVAEPVVAEAVAVEATTEAPVPTEATVETTTEPAAPAHDEWGKTVTEPATEPDPTWDATPAVDAAETAEATQATAPDAVAAEPTAATDSGDLFSIAPDQQTDADPRLSALGLTPDFAAAEAEAEAASFTPSDETGDEEIPEIADEAISARLANLVPDGEAAAGTTVSSRVVVTGLISVASIAGFKRHLSRAAGVQSVGVSSGPDGEFVFAVTHNADCDLRDVVPALPGFGARVTAEAEGEITVAARDPEAEG